MQNKIGAVTPTKAFLDFFLRKFLTKAEFLDWVHQGAYGGN